MSATGGTPGGGADRGKEPSTGELLTQATQDISTLVRAELELAKADLAESGKRLGVGVGAFGAAGVVALYGVGALIATGILALSLVLDAWLSALIVTVVLFVVAGIAAIIGKNKVATVAEPPKERVESVQSDVAAVKNPHDAIEGNQP